MSGSRARKRLLKTSVALTAAGAMAFAPLAPLYAQSGETTSATAPVEVRIGQSDGFTRVEFAGSVGARAQVRASGRTVTIRVASTATPDVSRLIVDPPAGVVSVGTLSLKGVMSREQGGVVVKNFEAADRMGRKLSSSSKLTVDQSK